MWKLALKSVWARKLRLLAVSVSVVLGVAFMSGTLVLSTTLSRTFDDVFSTAFKGVDAYVRGSQAFDQSFDSPQFSRPTVDAALVGRVAQVDGVRSARGSLQGYAQVVDRKGKVLGSQGAAFSGIWTSDQATNPFRLARGEAPASDDEVVLDYATANKAKYGPGDRITILTSTGPHEVRVSGTARFGTADSPGGATYVLLTEAAAQRLTGEAGKFDGIEVAAAPGVAQRALRDRIAKVLPPGTEVITGAQLTKETQDAIKSGLNVFNTILMVFAGISLFVGVLIIYNTFSILVAQRARESALLRAIGATRRQVARVVVVEAFVVGVCSGAVGLAAGVGLALGLKALLAAFGLDLPSSGLVVPGTAVMASFVVGVVATVASAWLPARRAGRIAPVAALRDTAIDRSGASKVRAALGALVLAAGVGAIFFGLFGDIAKPYIPVGAGAAVTFLGMIVLAPVLAVPVCRALGAPVARIAGVPGQLARENAVRNPKRTSSTAVALMVGVGLVGFMVILSSSVTASMDHLLKSSFSGDYVLRAPAGGLGIPMSVAGELRSQREVDGAAGIAFGPAQVDGKLMSIGGTEVVQLPKVIDADVQQGSLEALRRGDLGVQRTALEDHGWKLGQDLRLRFIDGSERAFRIGAVYKAGAFLPEVLMDSSTFATSFSERVDQLVMVEAAKGVSNDAAKAAVDRVASPYHLVVQDRTAFEEDLTSQVHKLLGLVVALLALAIVIALIGIAITLSLSVFERTHEIGLLRAVGMTRRQVRRSVRWEAVVIALYGTVLGLAVAVFFGVSLVQALKAGDQLTNLAVPVPTLVVVVVAAGCSGVLAALWPARRAARLDILRAISVE